MTRFHFEISELASGADLSESALTGSRLGPVAAFAALEATSAKGRFERRYRCRCTTLSQSQDTEGGDRYARRRFCNHSDK